MMTSIDAATIAEPSKPVIHPGWVRVTHWINAIAMLVMIGSGWQVYNASPLFAFSFPESITLGGWLAGALLWHFAAMWVLAVNGLVYIALGIATGRFRRKLLPITPGAVMADTKAALTSGCPTTISPNTTRCRSCSTPASSWSRIFIVLSGLSIWKPVQLQWLTALFGGYDAARYVHFFCMSAIVGFLVVHVLLALIVPKSIRAMVTGR